MDLTDKINRVKKMKNEGIEKFKEKEIEWVNEKIYNIIILFRNIRFK